MNDLIERYDLCTAAIWIRGHARNAGVPLLKMDLIEKDISALSEQELLEIINAGQNVGLKLYPFKKGTQILPRVRRVLGFFRSLQFENMLDIGSGRGVFLIPFMKEFPWVQITAVDLLEKRVVFLNELSAGGFTQMHAEQKNICDQPFSDNSYDVVSMLEVLEHIPEVEMAVAAAVKIARQYVVVSVPSKPDNNPEHIHLLTKERLSQLFEAAGCKKLHFDGVEGHLLMVAAVNREKERK